MDATNFRLLLRLSIAAAVLMIVVVSLVAGVDLGFDRRRSVIGVLGAILAIALIGARAARTRNPGSPPPRWAPDALLSKALGRGRPPTGSLFSHLPAAVRRARRRGRVREVELAALEAAEDEERLAPEAVGTSAEALFRLVQGAWNGRDPARLATLVSPEILGGWESSLEGRERAGGHQRAEVLGEVQIEYVGLARGAQGGGDRVIVLIEATLGSHVEAGRKGPQDAHGLCQYWTLELRDGLWIVLGIEDRAEGDRHLTDPIVPVAREAGR